MQEELRELANDPQQIRRLFERLKREGPPVVACYEAGVSGYDPYRQITALDVVCAVIAPALTPRRLGQRIKTDRRDAAKLVHLVRAAELTAVHVPDEAEEAGRDLLRCRDDIRRDVLRWRHRVLKLLARHGRVYLADKNWSQAHWCWVRAQQFALPPLQRAFQATLLAPVLPGNRQLSAMILLAEVVDFPRFGRPRALMAYLGLVPSEYSSRDTQHRGAPTKAGNSHAWRVLVAAAWHYRHRPTVGHALASRSQGQPSGDRRPGVARSSGFTGAIAISSAPANARRSPWARSRVSAALPLAARANRPDSSSKPPARQPCADALGKSFTQPREMFGCQHRPRDRGRRYKPLNSWPFHIS